MSKVEQGSLLTRVRGQFYLDSVALMRMSRALTQREGVQDAAMMMGTPANIEILLNAGLLLAQTVSEADAPGPGDLILSVRAETAETALKALDEAEQLLAQPQQTRSSRSWQPRSIDRAVVEYPEANLALISVPGAFAVSEARKAIRRGLHAMIFSDNVPMKDEAELKRESRDLGLLVMGPDCGTCVINGVPLAFANKLPRGDTGIIGASGTGIQEVSCLLAGNGVGISHAIGVGGRDLSADVGGISTLMALDALDLDEATRHIVVIGKPPAPEVAARIQQRIAQSSKTFTICFIGAEASDLPVNAKWASTLLEAAQQAEAFAKADKPGSSLQQNDVKNGKLWNSKQSSLAEQVKQDNQSGRFIRGLFCGGTLCAEAQVVCLRTGLAVSSNAAIPGVSATVTPNRHTLIDLGADEYTQGKPHPMIDPAVRDPLLVAALSDETTGVVIVDVVIGLGAHDDPAGQLVSSLPQNYSDSQIAIIASVTGTEDDPQIRSRQVARLQSAGVIVAQSNAEAATLAIEHLLSLAPLTIQ
jgi:succinyl-CoA synthetase alpha subunit